jgi:DNA-binding MarR family transcriptional regulator
MPPASARRAERRTATLDALRRIVRALRLSAGSVEAKTGLSAGQLFTLQLVGAEPGLSLTELAERTMTDRTSAAGMVDRLEARGLVERRPGAVDRRRTEVVASRRGRALLARAPEPPTQRVLAALDALDDAALDRVAAALETLVGAMRIGDEPATMLFDDGDAPPPARPPARGAPRASAARARRGA